MDKVIITIGFDVLGEISSELYAQGEDGGMGCQLFLFELINDATADNAKQFETEPDQHGVTEELIRFTMYKLDWERIKNYTETIHEGEVWDEAPAGEEER